MSDFNYPIQLDDSVYVYTPSDLSYNTIFNEIMVNSDIKDILKKIRIQLKLGVESDLVETSYFYVVLLDYFDALFEYYNKATDTEKSTFYNDYIKCVENIAICKSNPKLIRSLTDLVKIVPPVGCGLSYLTDNSSYYKSTSKVFIFNNILPTTFSDQYCFNYISHTFYAYYQERGVEDLNTSDGIGTWTYDFKDKSLFNLSRGVHNFILNRKINRTLSFLIDDFSDTTEKNIDIKFVTYSGDVVDNLDPNNITLSHLTYLGNSNSLVLITIDIEYDNDFDITTVTVVGTNRVTDITYLN